MMTFTSCYEIKDDSFSEVFSCDCDWKTVSLRLQYKQRQLMSYSFLHLRHSAPLVYFLAFSFPTRPNTKCARWSSIKVEFTAKTYHYKLYAGRPPLIGNRISEIFVSCAQDEQEVIFCSVLSLNSSFREYSIYLWSKMKRVQLENRLLCSTWTL